MLGLAAIGRPSNVGGITNLAELLRGLAPNREIIVVGENDDKPDGACPGKDGAIKTAAELGRILGRQVLWVLPPDGQKDVRAWANAKNLDPIIADAWSDAGAELARQLGETSHSIEQPSKGTSTASASPTHLTDTGNAQRVARRHGADLHFVHPWHKWLTWDGRRGQMIRREKLPRASKKPARTFIAGQHSRLRRIGEEESDDEERAGKLAALKKLLSHCLKWEATRSISACLESLRSEPGIPATPANLDVDPWR